MPLPFPRTDAAGFRTPAFSQDLTHINHSPLWTQTRLVHAYLLLSSLWFVRAAALHAARFLLRLRTAAVLFGMDRSHTNFFTRISRVCDGSGYWLRTLLRFAHSSLRTPPPRRKTLRMDSPRCV